MPDQMMRMAGRGNDGTAKAIKTTNDGIVETKNTQNITLFNSQKALPTQETVDTDIFENKGYSSIKLFLSVNQKARLSVYLVPMGYWERETGNEYVEDDEILIYSSEEVKHTHSFDVNLDSKFFKLRIRNHHLNAVWLGATSTMLFLNERVEKEFDLRKELEVGEKTLAIDEKVTFDLNLKEFNSYSISFYADNNINLNRENGLQITSLEYTSTTRYSGVPSFPITVLRGDTLDSYQPQLWNSGALSGGATTKIPMFSEEKTRIVIENSTGTDVTFRYIIVAHREEI